MNAASENPLLVAPRPVRLTSAPSTNFLYRSRPVRLVSAPVEPSDRTKTADDAAVDEVKSSVVSELPEAERPSPRLSPRSNLPSEALEEFLSILRPSFFPPSPPRARRAGTTSVPSFPYPYKSRGRIEFVQQKSDHPSLFGVEEVERARSTQLSRSASSSSDSDRDPDEGDGIASHDFDSLPMRWFSSNNLSSPVSRMHTRNPWQRHPSYEIAFTGLIPSSRSSPSALSPVPLSPSTVPLPPPTPGEIIEVA